jgi:hypothetical protein
MCQRAEPFTTPDDPSVFGRFDFIDLVGDREWRVTGLLALETGGPVVVRSLEVTPWLALQGKEPPAGHDVTSTVLRSLHIARIRDRAARELREWAVDLAAAEQVDWPVPDDEARANIDRASASAAGEVRGPGRQGFGDPFYRRLALRYLAFQEERDSASRSRRGIIRDLADEFDLAPTQARDAVATARERGWLTPGSPGRAGAEPGPRLTTDHDDKPKNGPAARQRPGPGNRR